MSLDPHPTAAQLLALKAEREGRSGRVALGPNSPLRPTPAPAAPVRELAAIAWPVRLVLPWSHLCSDNAKYGVIEGKLILTAGYRRAKGLIRDRARSLLGPDVAPIAAPVALEARVWVPDDVRAHDVPNFAKCCHDALEGVVYTKDRWLYDAHWIRAGVDIDAPRAELIIRPLAA